MTIAEETGVLGENPAVMPFRPPQISHGVAWDRTGASAGRRLTPEPWYGLRSSGENINRTTASTELARVSASILFISK